jgi:hypothetical protein
LRHAYKGHEYISLFQINPAHYNRQDVTYFGIFETVPVLQGEVLFHRTGISHGTGKAIWNRNVVFPWFLEFLPGDVFFELSARYTRGDVTEAYEDMTGMKWFPNGLGIKHFRPPFSFGAVPALTGLDTLSDALIKRRRIDNPLVIQDKKIFFGPDRTVARGYLARWKQNAVQKFLKAWEKFAAAEGKIYKRKFRGQDRSYLATHYNNRVKPTFETDLETVIAPGTYRKKYAYPEKPQPFVNWGNFVGWELAGNTAWNLIKVIGLYFFLWFGW